MKQSDLKIDMSKSCEWLAQHKPNEKYRTPQERQALAKRFFAHLREGKSPHSFREVHKTTLSRYLREYPEDFEGLNEAICDRMAFYEVLGIDLMTGDKKGNGAVFCKFMASEYPENWQDKPVDVSLSTAIFDQLKSRDIVNEENDEA